MKTNELFDILKTLPGDVEIRIGDIAETHMLHAPVGEVARIGGCLVLSPTGTLWKDETVAADASGEVLWSSDGEEPGKEYVDQ